ncbi:MAG TPA: hypothetical protein PLR73_12695 [Acetivibrio sp.]|nr:hypothetical protein [Acetivibrio sp.]
MQTNKNAAYCLGDNAATARNFYVIHNKSITQKRAKLNLDPLSIFGNEDYPTFEEWQAEYMPNSKCPIVNAQYAVVMLILGTEKWEITTGYMLIVTMDIAQPTYSRNWE